MKPRPHSKPFKDTALPAVLAALIMPHPVQKAVLEAAVDVAADSAAASVVAVAVAVEVEALAAAVVVAVAVEEEVDSAVDPEAASRAASRAPGSDSTTKLITPHRRLPQLYNKLSVLLNAHDTTTTAIKRRTRVVW